MADEIFSVKNDPGQLSVDEKVIQQLQKLHPASVSEFNEGNGPCIWILLIPTTKNLMDQFLYGKISEQELFERTPEGIKYDALYLCSAMTLPEYRNKGLTKDLSVKAIQNILKTHPVKDLFVWPFSKEGDELAKKIAQKLNLPLKSRKH